MDNRRLSPFQLLPFRGRLCLWSPRTPNRRPGFQFSLYETWPVARIVFKSLLQPLSLEGEFMTLEGDGNGIVVSEPYWEEVDAIQVREEVLEVQIEERPVGATDLPADQPQPLAEATPEPVPEPAQPTPKISQMEAMRQALADLGLGAKNAELADYIQAKFGIQPKNIAVLKSTAKKALFQKEAKTEPNVEAGAIEEAVIVALPAVALPADEPFLAPIPEAKPLAEIQDKEQKQIITYTIEEVEAVKAVCDRIGAQTLLDFMDIVGW